MAGAGVVRSVAPEEPVVSLRELATDAYHHKDRGGQLTAEASSKVRTNARSFGCTFVDLEVDVPVTPWEAALGAEIEVPTVEGRARVRIPAGIRSSQRIRIKGRGLGAGGERGDLYAAVRIEVPRRLPQRERELLEELARQSQFNPRSE